MLDYFDCYRRNIGLFSEEEQGRLRDAKVVIAGVGGVGGIEAAVLARMGVGELVVFDPGVFDAPDMNRQFGAVKSNLDRNKAVATAEMLTDINPFVRVRSLDYAPVDDDELDELLQGSALAIDAIDYMGFDYKAKFARAVRRAGLLNFTAPISGLSTVMMIFDPDGMTLETLYMAPDDPTKWPEHKLPLDRILGPERFGSLVADMSEGKRDYLSNCAGIATLNGGLVGTEAALVITGRRAREDLVFVPEAVHINLLTRVFEVFNPWEEIH